MNVLVILNDPPASSGRSDDGLRLAAALLRAEDANVRVFLLRDAVSWAVAAPRDAAAPHPVNPVSALINAGCIVAVSDTGMRDRDIAPADLVIGAESATTATLASWCLESERLLVF
jgi:uncharacterized protein involved in oxidation of intracellular sulfur